MTVAWRELLARESPTSPDVAVGLVVLDGGEASFEGSAADVFAALVAEVDPVTVAGALLAEGWSNGQGSMWLGPLTGADDQPVT